MSCCRNFLSQYFDQQSKMAKVGKTLQHDKFMIFCKDGNSTNHIYESSSDYLWWLLRNSMKALLTSIFEKFWNKGTHQLKDIIRYYHEGEQMHAALFFPYPCFFPLDFLVRFLTTRHHVQGMMIKGIQQISSQRHFLPLISRN